VQERLRVRPAPHLESFPTGAAKQCKNFLFTDIDGQRHVFACQIEEQNPDGSNPHPGQPHMARIPAVEEGDDIFVGWYHGNEQLDASP
jgi:proteasome lid subunit RPN8/RPN11